MGSEAITLALNGNRSNLVVICAEDKTVRLKDLKPGDSALY
ncbi:phage baseplate assembly protein, partial [Grimontia marina]